MIFRNSEQNHSCIAGRLIRATALILALVTSSASGGYVPDTATPRPWFVTDKTESLDMTTITTHPLAPLEMLAELIATPDEPAQTELLSVASVAADELGAGDSTRLMELELPIASQTPTTNVWDDPALVAVSNPAAAHWNAWTGLSETAAWDTDDSVAWYLGVPSSVRQYGEGSDDANWFPLPVAGLLVGVTFLGRHLLHKHSLVTSTS